MECPGLQRACGRLVLIFASEGSKGDFVLRAQGVTDSAGAPGETERGDPL